MGSRRWLRSFFAAFIAALLVAGLTATAGSARETGGSDQQATAFGAPDADVRDRLAVVDPPSAAQRAAADALRGATVRWNERQGLATSMLRYGGYLSSASDGKPAEVALSFALQHAEALGLSAADLATLKHTGTYRTKHNGVRQVFFEQSDAGRRVYGSVFGFTLNDAGRISVVGGSYYRSLPAVGIPTLNAEQAVRRAAATVGIEGGELRVRSAAAGPSYKTTFSNGLARGIGEPRDITAELVTFPMPSGYESRLAWATEQQLTPTGWYQIVVDAVSGDLLYRRNQVHASGPQGNVYRGENGDVGSQQITSFSGIDGSWVTDRTTIGNNVDAYHDLDGNDSSDYRPETPASGDPAYQHFDYTFTGALASSGGTDITTDRDPVITQAFYYTNVTHDYFYNLGFDEANRNFQEDNFGRGGAGGDRVNVSVDRGFNNGDCCNAFFGTPGDGNNPTMQVLVEEPRFGHGALDGDTIVHEYGHGVSNRLVAGGSLGGGIQTGAMGEGWGDWFAGAKWDDPVIFEYVNQNNTTGLRRVAYDNSPWVYTDLCNSGCGVHPDGEIWATVLWDLRDALMAEYGAGPGELTAELLVVDGMKAIMASSPDFLVARDAILTSDVNNNGGANQCLIWGTFAGRQMGFSAASSADQRTPTAGTDFHPDCIPSADANGPYNTTEGTNVTLDGTGSAPSAHPSGGAISYDWDLDNDGDYDDATGPTPAFTMVGNDGVFTIGLQVTNEAGASVTDSTTVTVGNAAPTVTLGTNAPKNEGSAVTVSGTISDPGWLDPLTATVDWDDGSGPQPLGGTLENSPPDATLTFSTANTYGDNGLFDVEVCGSDDDTTTCRSIAVQIDNVAPSVTIDPAQITNILEGDTSSVEATFTDPGWLDTYTAEIDWDFGANDSPTPGVTTEGPPQDEGEVSGSRQYGDDGGFTVKVTVTDDDSGAGSDEFLLTVDNVDPTADIDDSGAPLINGSPVFISTAGVPTDFDGESSDPGSDDLFFTWDFGDGAPSPDVTNSSLVNDPLFDGPLTPSVQPRVAVGDTATNTFADACTFDITLDVADDDLGGAGDTAVVLIQGTGEEVKRASYWKKQYNDVGTAPDFDADTLACYLEIARLVSRVFDEETALSDRADAYAVLHEMNPHPLKREKLEKQLLAVLLNFANGSLAHDQAVHDSDGDGILDTTLLDVIVAAEDVRLDPLATMSAIDEQTKILHDVNRL